MIGFGQLPSSELSELIPGAVVRGKDCVITSLGFPSSNFSGFLLAFAETVGHLRLAQANPCVGGVITTEDIFRSCPLDLDSRFVVFVNSPRETFWNLHVTLAQETSFYDNPSHRAKPALGKCTVAGSAMIHDGVSVGNNCIIADHVVLLPGTKIGNDVPLLPGVVIGSPGMGCKVLNGHRISIPYVGGVQIGDGAEVGALSVIEKGLFACNTTIGEETELGNLVRVGQGSRIGRRCVVGAASMIGESATVCDDVWVGPGTSISDTVTVGVGARLSFGAVVVKDVHAGRTIVGNLGIEQHRLLRRLRGELPQSKLGL